MLKLQKYDVTIVHSPGKDTPIADTQSRKFPQDSDSAIGDFANLMVHTVVEHLPISDERLVRWTGYRFVVQQSLRCVFRTSACALKQGTLPHLLYLWTEM